MRDRRLVVRSGNDVDHVDRGSRQSDKGRLGCETVESAHGSIFAHTFYSLRGTIRDPSSIGRIVERARS